MAIYVKKYPNGRRTTMTCRLCSKPFVVPNRAVARGTGKYCSVACKVNSQRRPMVVLACFTCGKSFERWPSKVAKARTSQAYCSWKCRKEGMSGPANSNWKNSPNWRGVDWDIARLAALHRDDSRCVECGKQDHILVHHIVEWEVSHDNDLANLRTLCMGCHTRIHNDRRAENHRTTGTPYHASQRRQPSDRY